MTRALLLSALLLAGCQARAPGSLAVPHGRAPATDGAVGDAEWADALRIRDGNERAVLLKQAGGVLHLAYTGFPPDGFGCLLVRTPDGSVKVLHASMQLGTARYRREGGVWNPEAPDYAWKRAERMWKEEGWKAGPLGPSQEFAVSFEALGAAPGGEAVLALGYWMSDGTTLVWPPSAGEGCGDPKLLAGFNPRGLRFEPSRWIRLRFPLT